MQNNTDKPDYLGKRALMLLRVSTPIQEEMYGWPSQERSIREKLLQPLGLVLDEKKHIIRDTYTGLEFRERPVLDHILDMARRHEFDVLCMDVLDRLGRKGVAREVFRMQLRELGIRILTTNPDDHADDDSLIGEMIRLIKGYQAEEELNNTRRRTMQGRREKALGNEVKGVPPKIVGNGHRAYGWKYIRSDKGKREGMALNHDIVYVDEDGGEWTEIAVRLLQFLAADNGITIRHIARFLTAKGIPTPTESKGIKTKTHKNGNQPMWQVGVISSMLQDRSVLGEAIYFKVRAVREPGRKWARKQKTTASEQVIIHIPPILTTADGTPDYALFDRVQERLKRNKQLAARNNPHPQASLLRAGLAKCGYCGANLTVSRRAHYYKERQGEEADQVSYRCSRHYYSMNNSCPGCFITVSLLDSAAWEYAVSIIRDPSVVDKRIQDFREADPTESSRKNITKKLKEIQQRQKALRANFSEEAQKRKLDKGTREFFTSQLQQLADEEERWKSEQDKIIKLHEQWKQVQTKLDELHAVCADMREKLDDPEYIPPYETKREICEFLGITATVWKKAHKPQYDIESRPPSIVSFLS